LVEVGSTTIEVTTERKPEPVSSISDRNLLSKDQSNNILTFSGLFLLNSYFLTDFSTKVLYVCNVPRFSIVSIKVTCIKHQILRYGKSQTAHLLRLKNTLSPLHCLQTVTIHVLPSHLKTSLHNYAYQGQLQFSGNSRSKLTQDANNSRSALTLIIRFIYDKYTMGRPTVPQNNSSPSAVGRNISF